MSSPLLLENEIEWFFPEVSRFFPRAKENRACRYGTMEVVEIVGRKREGEKVKAKKLRSVE